MKLMEVAIQYHKELNPKLWNGDKLNPEVRNKLLEIAAAFVKFIDIENFKTIDVIFTGSSANFNWTKKSDIDLHLLTKQSSHGCEDVTVELFDAKKDMFAEKYDISVYGIPVEMYVQDYKESHISTGVYSLGKDEWITKPKFEPPKDVDKHEVSEKTKYFQRKIDNAVKQDVGFATAKALMNRIKAYRQAGLEQEGEFSEENLCFKSLRNSEHLKKINDYMKKSRSKELSLI
jgi:predicted nucleotidyltransferase